MKYGLIILVSFLCLNATAKEISAITTNGKSVILHENGNSIKLS